jgi:hypothetical protein
MYTEATGSDANLSTACVYCPAGKKGIAAGGISVCSDCVPGLFAPSGNTECSDCVPGKYSGPAAGSCTACAPGKAGTISRAENETSGCSIFCNAGFYSGYAATNCRACVPGSFSGYAHPQISCTSCPPGKAGTSDRAQNETSGCEIHCTPGYYSPGWYYKYPTACSQCTDGYSGHTASTCTDCPDNSFSPPGSDSIMNCTCSP